MKNLFWISIILILYTYIGYPVLVYLLSLFYEKTTKGKYLYPTVSILLAVYNEETNIENKIQTLRELDYPLGRMEILIGSDGSTDGTDEIIKKGMEKFPEIKFYKQEKRKGKPSMLNLLVEKAQNDILVFTDARQRLDKNAVSELVKYMEDPKVGAVSGALFYESEDNNSGTGIGLYWKYEKLIRKAESRMGSMLGATGAFYAVKRRLYKQMPEDLILDDIYLPMKIVEMGYRAIFDKKAKVYDKLFSTPKEEFMRKTRTLAGNFQLFYYLRGLFNPFKGKISWQFFSHKFLRLMVPFLMIAVFISNLFILNGAFYCSVFALQIIFYCFALLGAMSRQKNKLFDIAHMFCLMNAAAVVGLYRFLMRKQGAMWEKAERTI